MSLAGGAASRRSVARRDVAALVLAASCWGLGTVVSKAALDEIPPLTLLPIQLAASLAILVVAMRLRGVSLRSGGSALLGRLGLLNPGIAYALSLAGLVTITASLAVLLWALEPLVILFMAAWFLHERITPSIVLLSMVALGRDGPRRVRPDDGQRRARRCRAHAGRRRLLRRVHRDRSPVHPGSHRDEPGDPRPAGVRARTHPGRRRARWSRRRLDRAGDPDAAGAWRARSLPERSTTPARTGSTSAPCATSRRR